MPPGTDGQHQPQGISNSLPSPRWAKALQEVRPCVELNYIEPLKKLSHGQPTGAGSRHACRVSTEPGTDGVENEFMRLIDDIVHRGRPRKHCHPPCKNLVPSRQMRQMQARKHFCCALLRGGELVFEHGEGRSADRRPDDSSDMVWVEAGRELRGGPTDDP